MFIAFYKHKKHIFDHLISWWTGGLYSHTEMVFDDGDGFICASSSNRDGGVRYKKIDLDPLRWDLVAVNNKYYNNAKSWYDIHAGEKYDYLGLLGFVWRRGTNDQLKWFCSESCAAAMGFNEPWRYDPNTLYAARGVYGIQEEKT